jgi:integrase
MTATPHSELDSRLKTLATAEENGEIATADADAIRTFVAAYNPKNLRKTPPGDETTLAIGSLNAYLRGLTEAARNIQLTEATADDVNGLLTDALDELGAWTVHGFSTAFKKFYGFHDAGPEPDAIATIDTPTGSTFDPDDVLTREEINTLLDAADNLRDRVVFALLVYTGMRNAALRFLRVGDVDPQAGASGTWTVPDSPDDADGLKGLGNNGTTRPLLAAQKPVRDWLKVHPAGDDPDAFLITGRPQYGKADPENPVAGSTIRRVMDSLVENADDPALERKPTHPHMMRHTFVTVCKRDYGMDDDTVKHLIGHVPGSKVMETTYAHLDDDDHIRNAEVAAGMRDPDEDTSPLTPVACDECGEPLAPTARACPTCGAVFGPDAHAVKTTAEDIHETATERAIESDPQSNDLETAVRQAAADPDAFMQRFQEVMSDD